VYNNLVENIRLNNFEKIIIPVKAALGQKNEIVEINYNPKSDMSASLAIEYANSTNSEEIKIITLDSLLNKCDIIKLDVEGFENEAIRGAKNVLKKYKPVLTICAYHKLDDLETIPRSIAIGNKTYKCDVHNNGELHLFCR